MCSSDLTFRLNFHGITLDTDNLSASGSASALTAQQVAAALRGKLSAWQTAHPGQDPGFVITANAAGSLKVMSTRVTGNETDAVFQVSNKLGNPVNLGSNAIAVVDGVDDTAASSSAEIAGNGVVHVSNAFGSNGEDHEFGTASFVYTAVDTANPDVDADALLTGREWVMRYIRPLASTDLLVDHVHTQTEVLAISKGGLLKGEYVGESQREEAFFRLLLRKDGKESMAAEIGRAHV